MMMKIYIKVIINRSMNIKVLKKLSKSLSMSSIKSIQKCLIVMFSEIITFKIIKYYYNIHNIIIKYCLEHFFLIITSVNLLFISQNKKIKFKITNLKLTS